MYSNSQQNVIFFYRAIEIGKYYLNYVSVQLKEWFVLIQLPAGPSLGYAPLSFWLRREEREIGNFMISGVKSKIFPGRCLNVDMRYSCLLLSENLNLMNNICLRKRNTSKRENISIETLCI